ncbi:hypothetical protein AVEN_217575-1 [Araneus ventricosus]|uniref:Uncharacterized protein n=1 Tax=Araneus ventricosus TaxID=182803 RepID=A0A4Y2P3Q1_ARAVE|nr:hypothetical protein AVEN_217575-1 [Araneus ventricosus]
MERTMNAQVTSLPSDHGSKLRPLESSATLDINLQQHKLPEREKIKLKTERQKKTQGMEFYARPISEAQLAEETAIAITWPNRNSELFSVYRIS